MNTNDEMIFDLDNIDWEIEYDEYEKLFHQDEATEERSVTAAVQSGKRDFDQTPLKAANPAERSFEKKPKQNPVWKDILFLILKIAAIVLTFVLLFTFLFGIIRYQDPAMEPAIKDGDLVIYYRNNRGGYLPQDVIVIKYKGKEQVRRVIATAGDTVDITEEGLVLNGALQQELSIYQKTQRYQDGVSFPLTVPQGEVFVLGDNRTNSIDSRIYGCVKVKDTIGKVMTIIRRRGI